MNVLGRKLKKPNKTQKYPIKTQKNPPGLVFFLKTRVFANPAFYASWSRIRI
jgi:hypothetical protein